MKPILNLSSKAYLCPMFKTFEFCIPAKGTKVPTGPDWFHEIKYDGYCLRGISSNTMRGIVKPRAIML